MTLLHATLRLQFDAAFPLDAAIPLVDQAADFGISHLAASPILAGRPGLPGGVVDHDTVDPRIGGEDALRRLVAALRRRHMGLIVDVTPATMAVGGSDNESWLDVLEWGRDSARAHWFDIDWRGAGAAPRNTVQLPFLDRSYGDALEAGALELAFDGARGGFVVRHGSHAFPISPLDYAQVLEAAELTEASALAAPFARLPRMRPDPQAVTAARRALAAAAATPEGRTIVVTAIGAFDGRTENGRARLHALLERQCYRLAWHATAGDALNWTRLADTTALALLRMERGDVFDATHATLLRLYAEGLVDGFVIRQWDLLADPAGYARRLRLRLDSAATGRPAGCPAVGLRADALPTGATPPDGWGVAGTAGAEAQDTISAVLHDPAGAAGLSDVWIAATGDRLRTDDQRADARQQALDTVFTAQLDRVVQALRDVAAGDLRTRDIPRAALRRVTGALAVAFPSRRTYADLDGFDATDTALFATAVARARRRFSPADAEVAAHVAAWLGGEAPRHLQDLEKAGAREQAIAAFQQLTAALARVAGDEMLANRHARLVSRGEAGCDPARIGLTVEDFHTRMAARAARCPQALTVTARAGQPRGEDADMRVAVLSETPRAWEAVLSRLTEITQSFRVRLPDGVAPEPADAAMMFQTLLGAWPPALDPDDALGLGALHRRLSDGWLKALRAARRRTDPLFPNAAYEDGCAGFLAAILEDAAGAPARRLIADTVARLAGAGVVNALSQTVLKCTVPGVPELRAGTELWDWGPDDGEGARAAGLFARTPASSADADLTDLLAASRNGRVKQATLARLLRLRAAEPALFRDGDYLPLPVEGAHARHALAFARGHRDTHLVTLVTRLPLRLMGAYDGPPRVPTSRWGNTRLALPAGGTYRDVLTGRVLDGREGDLALSEVLDAFPAAVLIKM